MQQNSYENTLKTVLDVIHNNAPHNNSALTQSDSIHILFNGKRIIPMISEQRNRQKLQGVEFAKYMFKYLQLIYDKTDAKIRRGCCEIIA